MVSIMVSGGDNVQWWGQGSEHSAALAQFTPVLVAWVDTTKEILTQDGTVMALVIGDLVTLLSGDNAAQVAGTMCRVWILTREGEVWSSDLSPLSQCQVIVMLQVAVVTALQLSQVEDSCTRGDSWGHVINM